MNLSAEPIILSFPHWDIRQNWKYFRHSSVLFRQSYEFIRRAFILGSPAMGYPPKSEVFPPFCSTFPPKL
jgi:hypothetical protein